MDPDAAELGVSDERAPDAALYKRGPLCEGLSRPERNCSLLLLSKAQSRVRLGLAVAEALRNGEREPAPSQADRKELKLHRTPSVRICSSWLRCPNKNHPYALQFLSMPLNDLVTLSLYFVDSHATWTCQRVCKLLLCQQMSWFMLPKGWGPGQGTTRHPCR